MNNRSLIALDARMAEHSGIGSYIRGLVTHFSPEQKDRLVLLGDPHQLSRYGRPVISAHESIYGVWEQWAMPGRLR
ncbi:MAG TPA: hypothetical protein P5079_07045, partial [Elusimicrobiota bacterium]|nr:hypothetical protein [Elusimicrobiota bacterium]